MNKTIIKFCLSLGLAMILCWSLTYGQASYWFRFTGTIANQHTDMDSIVIKNISTGYDTVLYWPDTVLNLMSMSTAEVGADSGYSIKVVRNGNTGGCFIVYVFIPEAGEVELKISDVLGRICSRNALKLTKGYHHFSMAAGNEDTYLVSSAWHQQVKSVKIITSPVPGPKGCSISYLGQSPHPEGQKSIYATNSFLFFPGNLIRYVAYHDTMITVIKDRPVTSRDYAMSFGIYPPCTGMESIVYGGQEYHTVKIGNQCWLRENLNIGIMIPQLQNQANNGTIEKYCLFDDPGLCDIFGGLYLWDEMMNYPDSTNVKPSICPYGWKAPSINDWCELIEFLDPNEQCPNNSIDTLAGGKMKETGFEHWWPPNGGATNQSGFTVLGAGGYQNSSTAGIKITTNFWSTTVNYTYNTVTVVTLQQFWGKVQYHGSGKDAGFSVRCIRVQ